MPTILESIPDLSTLVITVGGDSESDVGALLTQIDALVNREAGSPIGQLFTTFDDLDTALDIDVSGIAVDLPHTLQALQNALSANTLEFVESINEGYAGARDFLQDSALVQEVQSGGSLQDVALAVINDILLLFSTRLDQLAGNIIDSDVLSTLQTAASAIQGFRDDFPANQADFLPFVTDYLIGVSPDLLDAPLAHINTSLSVFDLISDTKLQTSLYPAQGTLLIAHQDLFNSIQKINLSDADGYVTIQNQLDALESATTDIFAILDTIYQQMAAAIAAHAWDDVFGGYVDLLEAVSIDDVLTIDDVVDFMAEYLEDVLARLIMLFDVDQVRGRLESLNQAIRDAGLASPMAQLQTAIRDALLEVQNAIADVPTEEIESQILGVLNTVGDQITNLGLDNIQGELISAFEEAEAFIITNINDTLKTTIQAELTTFADNFQPTAVTNLVDELTNAIAQLQTIIDDIETTLSNELSGISDLAQSFEQLSFKPVSDLVIAEIDDLKARLAQIDVNALSDAEKLALKGALAIVDAIDLDGFITTELKTGYHATEAEVLKLCQQIQASLARVQEKFLSFSPEAILSPINDLLDDIAAIIDQLNAQLLLKILYDQLDTLTASLESIAPGQLLTPLQGPYDTMRATVGRLNADVLVNPLELLYAEINTYIDFIDIVPLMDELENRQRQLFNEARIKIISELNALTLPPPLDGFFSQIQPLLELVTDAVFANPDTQLRQIELGFRNQTDLSMLFEPLDSIFLEFIELLETIPQNDLTSAMNTIRSGLGVGLQTLNPQTILTLFNQGYGQLVALGPTRLLGAVIALPSLKLAFEARAQTAPAERQADILAVSARFDTLISVTSPSLPDGQMQGLIHQHGQLLTTARARINALEGSGAQSHYAQLAFSLNKLLPDFLLQDQPLVHADVIAGVYALRPSTRAARLERLFDRVLREFSPLEEALETTLSDLFLAISEVIQLVNPLAVRDSVADVYTTLREKIQILDPDALRTAIEPLFTPLESALNTLDPKNIAALIDTAYNNVVNALTQSVRDILDDLVNIINEKLRAIKDSLQALLTTIRDTIQQGVEGIDNILTQLSNLIFVEIIDRICQAITNLGVSFDTELDRVSNAFDAMLKAVPISGSESTAVSI